MDELQDVYVHLITNCLEECGYEIVPAEVEAVADRLVAFTRTWAEFGEDPAIMEQVEKEVMQWVERRLKVGSPTSIPEISSERSSGTP
jgi:hypothetical protein